MKTYALGFLILAALFYTGCASHKPLAAKPVTHAQKPPLRPARPPIPRKPFVHASPRPRVAPVVHDTIRDTVFIREIQHKSKRKPCKP